ncbi:hypothetical protein L195_g026716 [Trifolium pratense]|uniref:Uncharacterized protein n=1 Tax=Trifolium pratense TaxID=57577 RepID=A0A2K3NK63_TRIPR|nr:hypothetical protein L195_g034299 [Trifolium pratense]PNY03389.1 hypothetical protein L195_g026716 [Trifolium pratense]
MTFVNPLCSSSFIASSIAIASPSIVEHFPWIQELPANMNLPMWSLTHQPTLAFPSAS